jgi:UDP-N-acetylmuramoyl-tripeptide--D-alanyl-D-alanine ligase
MTAGLWIVVGLLFLAGDARWLRVAQREHYEPGRITSTAALWCRVLPANAVLVAVAYAGAIAGLFADALTWVTLIALAWPWAMALRPRSGPLRFTARLRRLTALVVVLEAAACVLIGHPSGAALVAVSSWLVVDLALALLRPVENRLGQRYVRSAQKTLRTVGPTVVAITGSYGKTSTKLYTAHLLSRYRSVLASPASFNNLMGLSMTVNQRLKPGTDVFVAEMGTYGPGEIRRLCQVFPPDISAITTIGEAHLERMKDRATIVRAKSEITEVAPTVVLNVDVAELAELADRLAAGKTVVRCSTADRAADVAVLAEDDDWVVYLGGERVGATRDPHGGHPSNLAIAVGIASAAGVSAAMLAKTLDDLPHAPHRAEVSKLPAGPTVIDDTYNANPEGSAQALRTAAEHAGPTGTIWTITPGMVELGREQFARNQSLGAAATAKDNMVLVVTGRTNRRALLSGAAGASGRVRMYPNRTAAASAVLREAGAEDVILYENDLPDHYP